MKTSKLMEYALVALVALGCSARQAAILAVMEEMLKNKLHPADLLLMRETAAGEDYAPAGSSSRTWTVWSGKASTALGAYAAPQGFVTVKKGVYTLTKAGLKQVHAYTETWLKEARDD